ncbi:hypothetical protein [Kroppenstedtia guangzhouensis]|nr:hypothetical protein [Kroppenstedtia guangzhouensis]
MLKKVVPYSDLYSTEVPPFDGLAGKLTHVIPVILVWILLM